MSGVKYVIKQILTTKIQKNVQHSTFSAQGYTTPIQRHCNPQILKQKNQNNSASVQK